MRLPDYGGAYDIDPHMYWTKDDIMSLKDAVEEKDPQLQIDSIETDYNNQLYITYSTSEIGEMTLQEKIRIDLQKAGTAKDLCNVYAPVIYEAIQKEIAEYEEMIGKE